MQSLKEFLKNGKWKQLKKSDWLVLALIGVLLLIVTLPTGDKKSTNTGNTKAAASGETNAGVSDERTEEKAYVSELERKLERILTNVEGVGDVKVMITVADTGENIVEKDSSRTTTTTTEADSSGGSRAVSESNIETNTVFVESGNEKYPYVQKEKLPAVEGVVVVAEGGNSAGVVTEITEAVGALFPIEAHKIKVVPMRRTNKE